MDNQGTRTAIGLLLGGWLIGTIIIASVAAQNFWIVDSLLATSLHPAFHTDVGLLPAGEARSMLRYLVSEQNRFYFVWWGWAEAVLGIILLAIALRIKSGRMILGFALMLAITAAMQLYITPRIVDVGRALDFVPREPAPPGLRTFGILHAAYSILTLAKLAAGVWVAIALVRTGHVGTKPLADARGTDSEPRPQGSGGAPAPPQ